MKHLSQMILPEIGVEGQKKLQRSRVLLVGAGGLGVPASLYLASSGVGVIGIVDNDVIEESNIGRQVLYSTKDLGQKKSHTLCNKLSQLNADVSFFPYDEKFTQENHLFIAKDYDLIIHSPAVKENNPEIIEAQNSRIPIIHRSEMLSELMRMKYGVIVAGTHGKTTTTSILADRKSVV